MVRVKTAGSQTDAGRRITLKNGFLFFGKIFVVAENEYGVLWKYGFPYVFAVFSEIDEFAFVFQMFQYVGK